MWRYRQLPMKAVKKAGLDLVLYPLNPPCRRKGLAGSLSEMEDTLPATFLRVHRSHLINVMFVKSLNREPSGTGTLTLVEGSDIPVSRRVMPSVRQALA